MHGHAKILRAAAVTAAVAILVVAGRLISGSLDAPSGQRATRATGTIGGAARTGLLVTRAARAGWISYVP